MDFTFDIALKTRILFYKTLENLTLDQLNTKPKGFNNTIFWNIKHVVITQQLLIYRLSELPVLVTETEIETYKKGTKSESKATIEDIELLKYQLFSTLEKTKEDYQKGLFKKYTEYTVSTKSILTSINEALAFNNSHEGIHFGYILAMKKIL
ncbi:DinB family protein [Flavobacteriaceae bacterium]|jgi:hypothetical protein|nr:DinB family protein [Flavobacteriaceae bacterium]MDB9993218.1 DinB family protein [Flavobacteriaceae bacterium]MDC0538876.1 DinB family protein [Flavobacteriaceae bacterium]|tara:strand:- start:675 stop:1130 length:456 start_codon:yes stop_codon:yes gene_type:complete